MILRHDAELVLSCSDKIGTACCLSLAIQRAVPGLRGLLCWYLSGYFACVAGSAS